MFSTIEEAKEAINRYILNKEEFYKVYKLYSQYYIVVYKNFVCKFRIKAFLLIKKRIVVTIFTAYFCSSVAHYKNKQFLALWYLKDFYKAFFINNNSLTPV